MNYKKYTKITTSIKSHYHSSRNQTKWIKQPPPKHQQPKRGFPTARCTKSNWAKQPIKHSFDGALRRLRGPSLVEWLPERSHHRNRVPEGDTSPSNRVPARSSCVLFGLALQGCWRFNFTPTPLRFWESVKWKCPQDSNFVIDEFSCLSRGTSEFDVD